MRTAVYLKNIEADEKSPSQIQELKETPNRRKIKLKLFLILI